MKTAINNNAVDRYEMLVIPQNQTFDQQGPAAFKSESMEIASIVSKNSYKASRRRLRTETLDASKIKAVSDELLDALTKYGNNPYGIPAIHYAIMLGDENAVRLFLDHGASPNSIVTSNINLDNPKPNTALDYAAKYGQVQIAKLLLGRGASLKYTASDYQYEPDICSVIFAAQGNHPEIIKLLVEKGTKIPSFTTEKGHKELDVIYCALKFGSVDALKVLLDLGCNLEVPNIYAWDPIVTATNSGEIEMVRFLLDQNISVESTNASYWGTPLMAAVHRQDIEMIKFLLSNRAKNILPDMYGPLEAACMTNNPMIIELLLKASPIAIQDLNRSLFVSVQCSTYALCALIKAGVDVNAKDKGNDGKSAFLLALRCGNFEAMKILLENGADINAKDDSGRTALKLAVDEHHPEFVEWLIAHGAK